MNDFQENEAKPEVRLETVRQRLWDTPLFYKLHFDYVDLRSEIARETDDSDDELTDEDIALISEETERLDGGLELS